MARKKAPALNASAPPKPVEAAQSSGAVETPSGSFSTAATSTSCPNCGSSYPDMSTTEFEHHVATCNSSAGDNATDSSLSPPPESPRLDNVATTAAAEDEFGLDAGDSEVDVDDIPDDILGAGQPGAAANENFQLLDQFRNEWQEEINDPTTNADSAQPVLNDDVNQQNSTQTQPPASSSQSAVNQIALDESEDDDNPWRLPNDAIIEPYVAGEYDVYEYKVLKKQDKVDEVEAEAELNDDEGQTLLDLEDPKVTIEPIPNSDEENLDEVATPNNEVADRVNAAEVADEGLYNADTPAGAQTPTRAGPSVPIDDLYDATPTRPSRAKKSAPLEATRDDDLEGADTPQATATPEDTNDVDAAETPELTASSLPSQSEGADVIKASEALNDALGTAGPVESTDPNINESGEPAEQAAGDDLPGPSQVDAEKPVESEVSSQVAENTEDNYEKVILKHKKLTSLDEFREFLGDAEQMPYEQLYTRLQLTGNCLSTYQDEYTAINKDIFAYEQEKAHKKELLDEAKKELADERKAAAKQAQQEEDRILIKMQKAYAQHLTKKGDDWTEFLVKFDHRFSNSKHPDRVNDCRRIRSLHDPAFVALLTKRQKAAEKEAQTKITLVNGDLPPLNKKDNEPQHKHRREGVIDPIKFDEMKQADVYGQQYNALRHMNQKLVDRNALNTEEDELNANGRPKRDGGKKRRYDTEQSGSAQDTEPDDLPAKRQRKARNVDGNESPVRIQGSRDSRDGTPNPRTFKSGKRIGRPPGSKTLKPSGRASKLNEVVAASPSESDVEADDEGKAKKVRTKKGAIQHHGQDLAKIEEDELQAAATSVAETRPIEDEVGEPAPAPAKKKHAGGRPKKNVPSEESIAGPSNAPVEEVANEKRPRNKGGRPPKKTAAPKTASKRGGKRPGAGRKKESAAQRTAAQIGEEDEVLQSTEQDNESQFPSTNPSRPTTSSSGGSDATFGGGRPTRRAATRANSMFKTVSKTPAIEEEDEVAVAGPSTSTNGRRRRKRPAEDIQPTPVVTSGDSEGENIVVDTARLEHPLSPIAKKRKLGGRRKKAAPAPIAPKEESTPEDAGEAATTTTTARRPQRKRVAALPGSSIDPDQLGHYLSDDDGETPPPPKRRPAARGGRKTKSVKREQTTDIDTGIESSALPTTKRAVRAPRRKAVKTEVSTDYETAGEMVNNGEGSSAPPKKRKARDISQAPGEGEVLIDAGVVTKKKTTGPTRKVSNKGKGIASNESVDPEPTQTYTPNEPPAAVPTQNGNEDADLEIGVQEQEELKPAKKRGGRVAKAKPIKVETEEEEDSADYSGIDPVQADMMRKKKRKSKKLAAATKARWAAGKMAGPMLKRKQTNADKRAARVAATEAKKNGGSMSGGPSSAGGGVAGPSMGYDDGALDMDDGRGMMGMGMGMSAAAPVVSGGGNGYQGHGYGAPAPQQSYGWGVPQPAVPYGKKVNLAPLYIAPAPPAASPAAAPRRTGRAPKPTPRSLGYDGAADSGDEAHTPTEYERFQQLSSPKGNDLGKRARKSYMDLSALGDDEEEEFTY